MPVAAILLASALLAPREVSAEGLFDMFFGGLQKQLQRQAPPPQANFFADPFQQNQWRPRHDKWPPAAVPLFACEAATASIFR